MFTHIRRERRVRNAFRRLAKQRVFVILQPGNMLVIEGALNDGEEHVAEALRICHLRGGWVEILKDNVPMAEVEDADDIESVRPDRYAPTYRLTDAGWAQIRRTHAWVMATCRIALATLVAAGLGLFVSASSA